MLPPATADALAVTQEDVALVPARRGLELRFEVGEQIPWKGIWFKVEMLTAEAMLIKPVGETWQHNKKRTGRA